jgi:hypothetical protein
MRNRNLALLIAASLLVCHSFAGTLAPPDLSDEEAQDPISLNQLSNSHGNGNNGQAEATTEVTSESTASSQNEAEGDAAPAAAKPESASAIQSPMRDLTKSNEPKPQIQTAWVMRTKKVKECKRVIKILREPKQVCGWETQDQCRKVPHREKAFRYDCDTNNYCHKVTFFKTTYSEQCKQIRKRVCKKWDQIKRVPQRICADKIQRLKCLKTEKCTNHKKCLKWVNEATNEGFKYRQCLRWIQFRRCGVSYSDCSLVHESAMNNS